jgi:hypothetical protein
MYKQALSLSHLVIGLDVGLPANFAYQYILVAQ